MMCIEDEWFKFGDYEFGGHEGTLFVRYSKFDSILKRSNEWVDRFNIVDYKSTLTSNYGNSINCYSPKNKENYSEIKHLSYYPVDWEGDLIDAFEEFEKQGLYIKFNCVDLKAFLEWLHFSTAGTIGDGFGNYETISLDRFKFIKNYGSFRYQVLKRDNFRCICCGNHENLEVHHIYSFKNHLELGDSVSNGITLCNNCHDKFHNKFGFDSNPIDFIEFIKGEF